jgi:hypothetical protein
MRSDALLRLPSSVPLLWDRLLVQACDFRDRLGAFFNVETSDYTKNL